MKQHCLARPWLGLGSGLYYAAKCFIRWRPPAARVYHWFMGRVPGAPSAEAVPPGQRWPHFVTGLVMGEPTTGFDWPTLRDHELCGQQDEKGHVTSRGAVWRPAAELPG
jgi:hypothetical protein